jgi:hypothetical protein
VQAGNRATKANGNPQTAINQLKVLHNAPWVPPPPVTWNEKINRSVLHAAPLGTIPLPPVSPAPTLGEIDMPAATITAQASTLTTQFDDPVNNQHGEMRAIFVPVNVADPCGEWTLKTMYPMNI